MIQFLTDPQNLLSVGVAVAVFATVFTLLSSMGGGVGLEAHPRKSRLNRARRMARE